MKRFIQIVSGFLTPFILISGGVGLAGIGIEYEINVWSGLAVLPLHADCSGVSGFFSWMGQRHSMIKRLHEFSRQPAVK